MLKLLYITVLVIGDIPFKELCKKNGAEDRPQVLRNATKNCADCLGSHVNVQAMTLEIQDAKPKGTLNEVFKKFCAKSPQMKQCFHELIDGVSPCLEESARARVGDDKTAVDQLLDFMCYNDGDRIALFYAEGGPECFSSKSAAIITCAERLQQSVPNAEVASALTITNQCGIYDDLTSCIVNALEECDTPSPGNMVDSLFRHIRKHTLCKDIQQKF